MDWLAIIEKEQVSDAFLKEHLPSMNIGFLLLDHKLNESFLTQLCRIDPRVDWLVLSCYQDLTEQFMIRFQDQLVWEEISKSQTLSESFILQMKDRVDWREIQENQSLSISFILENIQYFNMYRLFMNPCIYQLEEAEQNRQKEMIIQRYLSYWGESILVSLTSWKQQEENILVSLRLTLESTTYQYFDLHVILTERNGLFQPNVSIMGTRKDETSDRLASFWDITTDNFKRDAIHYLITHTLQQKQIIDKPIFWLLA